MCWSLKEVTTNLGKTTSVADVLLVRGLSVRLVFAGEGITEKAEMSIGPLRGNYSGGMFRLGDNSWSRIERAVRERLHEAPPFSIIERAIAACIARGDHNCTAKVEA